MRILLIITFIQFITHPLISQIDSTITLKDLEIPNSPAFILLDKAPSTIEKPTNAKAITISALNAFNSNNGFPKDYGIEIVPHWFFNPKSNDDIIKYGGYKDSSEKAPKQRVFNNVKNASISVAFLTNMDTLTGNFVNNISIGLRSNLLTIRSKKHLKTLKRQNDASVSYLKELNKLWEGELDYPIQKLGESDSTYRARENRYNKNLETLQKKGTKGLDLTSRELKDSLYQLVLAKPILSLDGALAHSFFFENQEFSTRKFGRLGAWLTLNLNFKLKHKNTQNANYFSIYGIARFLKDATLVEEGNYTKKSFNDLGYKLEFEFKQLVLSYEYIKRFGDTSNTKRSSGLIKYKINNQLYLTGAYGDNFGDTGDLISFLGINWGLSTGKEKVKID